MTPNELAYKIWTAICMADSRNKITMKTQVTIEQVIKENLKALKEDGTPQN